MGGRFIQLDETLNPYNGGIFSHEFEPAYPLDRSQALFPSVLRYGWSNA
jgi:hypothetical protein